MAGWGAAEKQNKERQSRSAATPVTFAGTIGLFTSAATPSRGSAVLFLSPWGFEEMCVRKFWRILAEDLAHIGVASLRFDYAGTGDALDLADDGEGLKPWQDTALAAAAKLKALSGCDRLILVSQGLGGTIAATLVEYIAGVDGIAFLAPVISGRAYLRELTVWSKMIDEGMGLAEAQRQTDGVTVASLRMPDSTADAVKKLNLMTLEGLGTANCLVLTRPGRPGDADFAHHLETLGPHVTQASYEGYDDLVSNPTVATMPTAAGRKLVEWVQSVAAETGEIASTDLAPPVAAPLIGEGFRETPLRFGAGNRMFGILCEPEGARTGATALLLTTAYDRSAGWGRMSVTMARALARDGIASLRFDTANVGDSPPLSGAPEQVLYSGEQHRDVAEALDLLEKQDLLPAYVVGRCSGGYLAFQAALRDTRCGGLITVNPYSFHWDESQSVDEALRFAPRSLETYGRKLLQLETLKRLFGGQIDAKSALCNMATGLGRRAVRASRQVLGAFPFFAAAQGPVLGGFRTLTRRGVDMSLIYSAHDIGLDHLHDQFGDNGAGLKHFPDIRLTIIPEADHNLTPPYARKVYLKEVREMGLRLGSR
ncbi:MULTISPECIES: alpha/beta fold hydrolase [unclassified Rhizobium]|jgi:pimeloyl-ACP methyl ester carboxylesterase|uniref:alpha/beta fold hydrolase n=1 Tax=unclassified Rhizobium TaxID=2613769 RepID=UPI00064745A2|nr:MULTISPECIES: alpha/beta fold hydrolase [unclassified Rhizobium]MBN8951934.1 alpha/beta fold hydrolase [Rhizobium tropici]OJY73835.1 MAG: alpha/beta hydrolase [Rhizobium sp. 60-20]RKD61885.1 alpha/beta hydrolase family protein [Rhizobium sp. WW_1]